MKHINKTVVTLLQNSYTELEHIINNISSKENFVQVQSSEISDEGDVIALTTDKTIDPKPILYRWWVAKDVLQKTMLGIIKNKIENYNSSKKSAKKYNPSQEELERLFLDERRKKENLGDTGKTYYALYFGKSMQGQKRINQHIKEPMKNSTVRRNICGLFVEPLDDSNSENEINNILVDSYFEVLPLDDSIKGYIDCLESICIAFGHYPLNIEGNHFIDMKWLSFLKSSRKTVK